MANNWAVTIGINQYIFFQPLGCAQADAEALKEFLTTEGGFLPQQCLLMTDTSPPIGDRSTYPTKENILFLLEDLAAACWQPQDKLWLFFSGYGVNYEGHDYLMPVEGNPNRVEATGIEIRALMQSLQVAGLDVLLLLDINRAFGTQTDALVGQETIELAQELQITTILSCQPEQFSYESNEVGHGFFTAALLEALRFGNANNLADLERYLSIRTPELCQHHWRPTQNPVTIITSSQQVIWPTPTSNPPQDASILDSVQVLPPAMLVPPVANHSHTHFSHGNFSSMEWYTPGENGTGAKEFKSTKTGEHNQPLHNSQLPKVPEASTPVWAQSNSPLPHHSPTPTSTGNHVSKQQIAKTPWQYFLLWGTTATLLFGMILIVVFRNQPGFKGEAVFPALQQSDDESQAATTLSSELSEQSTPTPMPVETQSPPTPSVAEDLEAKKRNQTLLDQAKKSLRQTQASDLSLAIATARKIKPGEPLYEQAQENIKMWSYMILDLAEGRAKEKRYSDAIAAAQLINQANDLHPKAQAAINQWQLEAKQYVSNKTLIEAANALIRSGQASSYNRAIEVAKRVEPGEPGYDIAQKSIDTWSEKIFALAEKRAAQGDIEAAVKTAILVPEGTAAYQEAQQAIQTWQPPEP